jgi:hypothetical protein
LLWLRKMCIRLRKGYVGHRKIWWGHGCTTPTCLHWCTTKTNRISADGDPSLCTSVVGPGGLPRAIPISTIPKIHTERKKQIEYNIYLLH